MRRDLTHRRPAGVKNARRAAPRRLREKVRISRRTIANKKAARLARLRECTPQRTHLLPFPLSPSPFKNDTSKKELVERRHSCAVVTPSHHHSFRSRQPWEFAVVPVSRRRYRDGKKESSECDSDGTCDNSQATSHCEVNFVRYILPPKSAQIGRAPFYFLTFRKHKIRNDEVDYLPFDVRIYVESSFLGRP